jgi:hypothetical protein
MFDRKATIELQIRRGEEARALLDNQLLRQAIIGMERDIISGMKSLKPEDVEGRDAYWRELRALERFQRKFTGYIRTGETAKKSLVQRFKDSL